jgi:hypothetical protein
MDKELESSFRRKTGRTAFEQNPRRKMPIRFKMCL